MSLCLSRRARSITLHSEYIENNLKIKTLSVLFKRAPFDSTLSHLILYFIDERIHVKFSGLPFFNWTATESLLLISTSLAITLRLNKIHQFSNCFFFTFNAERNHFRISAIFVTSCALESRGNIQRNLNYI